MAYNSKVILCKGIKMDRDYKDVIDYTEEQMLNLCLEHKVTDASDFNYVRENGGQLNVPYSIDICLKANYMAFQNPDYSRKWFFAWVDEVHYIAPGTTRIIFTIDYWSTWFYKFNVGQCFIIREHVKIDNIGQHTLDEGLETGEYYANENPVPINLTEFAYVLSTTVGFKVDDSYKLIVDENATCGGIYNGIFNGTNYFISATADPMVEAINSITKAGKIATINGLFTYPGRLIGSVQEIAPNKGLFKLLNSNSAFTDFVSIDRQDNIQGYVPKNNKLLCYPYNYLLVNNGSGQSNIYRYEFSNNPGKIDFTVAGVICPGGSIRLNPSSYNGTADFIEGINLGKFPICGFAVDMYTNWLTQNSVNIGGSEISTDLVNAVNSGIDATSKAGIGDIAGAFNSVYSNMIQTKQHSLIPVVSKGNVNGGDVIASNKNLNFQFYKMSIHAEYARKIDEFFTRFGYKVNRLDKPYINARPYWDYLQIAGNDDLGSGEMPQKAIDTINNCARAGVTIWHDHDNIGNYSLDNSPINN